VVLHIPDDRRSHLAEALSGALPVREAGDKEPLLPGTVVVGPPGYHLLVGDRSSFALSTEAPVHFCRPAIDVLFETAADVFGARLAGVLLTGANADGALGLERIEARGGWVGVQDPATADVPTMPQAGIAACLAPRIGTIDALASLLVSA
jgi:two-component system, chemotaxis family, protein-glutamate methylesterase/glutaminase